MTTIDWNPSDKVLRQFAVALIVFVGFLGVSNFIRTRELSSGVAVAFLIAAIFSALSFLYPKIGRWPFVVASLITFPVGMVVSFCALMVLYFCVVTPIGFALRLSGRDSLRLKRLEGTDSYWIPREPDRPKEYYLSQ